MQEGFGIDAFSRLVERVLTRASRQSRVWVGTWLTGILLVTTIAVVSGASLGAYVILFLVAAIAISAGGELEGDGS